jgi:hypothetical protein
MAAADNLALGPQYILRQRLQKVRNRSLARFHRLHHGSYPRINTPRNNVRTDEEYQ